MVPPALHMVTEGDALVLIDVYKIWDYPPTLSFQPIQNYWVLDLMCIISEFNLF